MLLWVLLVLIVLLSVGCVAFKDLLYVAVSLAMVSIILALVLFHYGANIAGVFELSVCAGLITVLFVSTVSLTRDSDKKEETRFPAYLLPLFLAAFIGLSVLIMQWLSASFPPFVAVPAHGAFQQVFWELRSSDILGQVALILAGVFGILALFRLKTKEKNHE